MTEINHRIPEPYRTEASELAAATPSLEPDLRRHGDRWRLPAGLTEAELLRGYGDEDEAE